MNSFQILSTIIALIISVWLMSKCYESVVSFIFGGFFAVSLLVLTIYFNGVFELLVGSPA